MSWINYIGDDKKTIEAIFKEKVPELIDIEIKEIILGYQYTNSIKILFDLCNYPDEPPLKWKQNGENEISIELSFSEIYDYRTTFWECQYNKKSEIRIKKYQEKFHITIIGETINISFIANSISMLDFQSYIHEDRQRDDDHR